MLKRLKTHLIWIVIDEATFPSTIVGVYPSYREAMELFDSIPTGEEEETRIVGWDIIHNREVNYTNND